MGRYDHPEVVLTLFLDQSDFKDVVESRIQTTIIKGSATPVAVSKL
jgi:hypothetical protein